MSVIMHQHVFKCSLCGDLAWTDARGRDLHPKIPEGWAQVKRTESEWHFCSLDCLTEWVNSQ